MNGNFTRITMSAWVFALLPLLAAGEMAEAADSQPTSWEAQRSRLLDELTPVATVKWGRHGETLNPDGRELAEWFLHPLADGRGPLTPQELAKAGKDATKDQRKLESASTICVSGEANLPQQIVTRLKIHRQN